MFGFDLGKRLRGKKNQNARSSEKRVGPTVVEAPRQKTFQWVSNVMCLIDVSGSVGQEALDHVRERGIPCIVKRLCAASAETDIVYNVAVRTFSSESGQILPFTDARKVRLDELPKLVCGGVTMMEPAIWEALALIDAEKSLQDEAKRPRVGSLLVIVTDGRNTDFNGCLKSLSDELVCEIRQRNESRSISTFAIGMGESDDLTLLQLGPVVQEVLEGGERVSAARAVRYTGDDYRSSQCWEAVCGLIGQASSSSTGRAFVVGANDAASDLPDYAEVIELDSNAFRVVK